MKFDLMSSHCLKTSKSAGSPSPGDACREIDLGNIESLSSRSKSTCKLI